MSQKVAAEPSVPIIRYTGIFDFNGLYQAMVKWLKSRRYWFHEDVYKHKPGGPFGKELEISWRAEKKVTDFHKTTMKVSFHIWDLKDVEVIKDGKKKKLQKARIEIKLNAEITLEYQNRWQKSKFYKALYKFYTNYVIKKEWTSFWGDTVYYRLIKFHAFIKNYLDMEAKANEYEHYLGDSQ